MIDFVAKSPFLRITLRVVMATMHFHIAQTGLFLENILFMHLVSSMEHLTPMKNGPSGAR